jgi:hypothetical protein
MQISAVIGEFPHDVGRKPQLGHLWWNVPAWADKMTPVKPRKNSTIKIGLNRKVATSPISATMAETTA